MSEDLAAQEARIALDRERLAETVQALAERVDVPARTRAAVVSLEDRLRVGARRYLRAEYLVPAVVFVAGTAVALASARWRRS